MTAVVAHEPSVLTAAEQATTRVRALAGYNPLFYNYVAASAAKYCLKLTSEKAGIGLRRENFGIPESKKFKPSILGFWV